MRGLFALLSGVALSSPLLYRELEQCVIHDLEIVILMDVSGGTRDFFDEIADHLSQTVKYMETAFTSVKVGLANFVDKPNVYVGVGSYGGYPGWYHEDWCYDLVSPLQTLTDSSVEEISTMIRGQKSGAGLDMYDAHFEALVKAAVDPQVGWSLRDSQTGHRLSKLVLMVTDHFGHTGEFLPVGDYVDAFNADVYCDNGRTKGGFGAMSPSPAIPSIAVWTAYDTEYYEFAGLKERIVCGKESLSEEETARYQYLENEFLSLTKMPKIEPFNLNKLITDPQDHCRFNEYPKYADITSVLNDEEIALAVLLVDMENQALNGWSVPTTVWNWALTDKTALGGSSNTWRLVDGTNAEKMPEIVLDAVSELFPPTECPIENPTTTEVAEEVCEPEDCDGSCCDNLYEIFFDIGRKPSSVEVEIMV